MNFQKKHILYILLGLLILLVGFVAYAAARPPAKRESIERSHDDDAMVTCWVLHNEASSSVALSCLPDANIYQSYLFMQDLKKKSASSTK